jgi:exodeoxyribonuclease V gamma subunit
VLHIHRSDRADPLLAVLTDVVSEPTVDALVPEIVCVPSRGIERWISQGIATKLGVSANTRYPSPQALVEQVIAESTGRDRVDDPWVNGQLLWGIGTAIDAHMGSSWLHLVASQINQGQITFSGGEGRSRTDRVATFQYIRDLFATYHWMRPEMVLAWRDGHDVGPTGEPLAPRSRWQPRLWREVRDRLALPSPPELLAQANDQIAAGSVRLDLPTRISAFGLTRLPSSVLSVLAAISVHRDVHLFALHPSNVLWRDVAAELSGTDSGQHRRTRDSDLTAVLAHNSMLASWGRDSRELQLILDSVTVPTGDHYYPVPEIARDDGVSRTLGRLQRAIRLNRPDDGTDAELPESSGPLSGTSTAAASDSSLQIHSCHGPVRQVEVLRDAILHQLRDDPTLEPRDIVIMCPDVETFAPHISAVFGEFPQLRVRIADQSVLTTNPMISAVMDLHDLADSRCTATEVMSFLHLGPVKTRFELTDDGLDRLENWVVESGVRWGLDARHRSRWGLVGITANTWESGLNRILAGVVMADEDQRLIGSVRPLDDVPSADIDLAGQLAEFYSRLRYLVDSLSTSFEVGEGLALLRVASEELMAAVGPQEWQSIALRHLLDELELQTGSIGLRSRVTLNEFRDLVSEKLSVKPTRTNFRSGDITVCTLTPMRSVPHRVVALLGLDDGVFPRKGKARGDDLTRIEALVGDHDIRAEDRQLLLDAVLAAQDALIITYSGRSERTNECLAPAVPLAELMTSLRYATGADNDADVVISHPLQAFDRRNFEVGALLQNRSWGFDRAAFRGAERVGTVVEQRPPFWTGTATASEADSVSVDELVRFFQHPVKEFVVRRLNLRLQDFEHDVMDEMSLELGHLELWAASQRLLEAVTNIEDESSVTHMGLRWMNAEMAAGTLPPGGLATEKIRAAYPEVMEIARQTRHMRAGHDVTSRAVRVQTGTGALVYGSVGNVCGTRIVDSSFSRLQERSSTRAKPRIAAWIRLVALAASYPDEDFTAAVVGRGKSGSSGSAVAMTLLSAPEQAASILAALVEVYRAGMAEPLPFFAESAQAFAAQGGETVNRVRGAWESTFYWSKEDQDPYIATVFPDVSAEDLCKNPRFVELASTFWDPLFAHDETRAVR